MRARLTGLGFLVLLAGASSACSSGPVAQPGSDAGDSAAAATARQPTVRLNGEDYRLVVRRGVEYFCRRETSTGSRVNATEVCLTEEQIEAQREGGQEFARESQSPAMQGPEPGAQPGAVVFQ